MQSNQEYNLDVYPTKSSRIFRMCRKKHAVTAILASCRNQNFGRAVTGHGACRIDRNGTVAPRLVADSPGGQTISQGLARTRSRPSRIAGIRRLRNLPVKPIYQLRFLSFRFKDMSRVFANFCSNVAVGRLDLDNECSEHSASQSSRHFESDGAKYHWSH